MKRISISFVILFALSCENKAPQTDVQPIVSVTNNAVTSTPETTAKTPVTNGDLSTDAPPDVAAPPEHSLKKESGVAYVTLHPGTGDATPTVDAIVTAEYIGWTTNGKKFDSSSDKGKPLVQRLGNLITGWQEGVLGMKKGEVRRMWIPEELGYKNNSDPSAPKGMIVFDVKLIDFEEPK